MVRAMQVRHSQVNGVDVVEIRNPYGDPYLSGKWPVAEGMTEMESAVSAMFAGMDEAGKHCERFGVRDVAVYSDFPGALEAFDREVSVRD